MMPGESTRRFSLADAMILVAAMAVATLAVRATMGDLGGLAAHFPERFNRGDAQRDHRDRP